MVDWHNSETWYPFVTKLLSIAFAGTPEFAKIHLKALIDAGYSIAAVFTQPDRPAGRGRQLQASPVKKVALEHDLRIFQPQSLKKELDFHAQLKDLNVDLLIVVAYGIILPQAFLDISRLGAWNVHGSILPRWRGAAPIQRAILAADKQTGITIMQMDAGLDTGDMLLKSFCDIDNSETGSSLHDKLAALGKKTLLQALQKIDSLSPEKQNDELSCYAKKLDKAEAQINWQQDALLIDRQIRAFNSWPVCHSIINGDKIRIWQATVTEKKHSLKPGEVVEINKTGILIACDKNMLRLTQIQLPGKKSLSIFDLLNGKQIHFNSGDRFE